MSYKVDLSRPDADASSLTQQLVDRFARAIDAGVLEPGERLPTIRALAESADINQLTAARIYRRLAELGYVTATVGRGTFVRTLPPFASDALADDWQAVALRAARPTARERLLREAMSLARVGEVITLGAGLPAPETLPVARLAALTAEMFAELGADALSYTDVEGLPELRSELGAVGRAAGFAAGPEEIIITSGARQAIDLVARTVLADGDVACVEAPTFVGTISSLESTGARLIGIPSDAAGFDVDALERVLSRHPVKLVALQPSCQNPTGRHLSAERRRRLLELARERSFFVLEDRVYAGLDYVEPGPEPLRVEAPGHVITVDSMSKTIGGGVRIGWLAARGPIFSRLVGLKMASDLNTSPLAQRIVARYLKSGHHADVLDAQRTFYRHRRDWLLAALERHLPGEYDALEPLGGHNLWLQLRRPVDERALYAEALRRGVSFTPGHAVLVEESQRAAMRLTFSLADEEQMDEGIRRLAAALSVVLRAERLSPSAPVA